MTNGRSGTNLLRNDGLKSLSTLTEAAAYSLIINPYRVPRRALFVTRSGGIKNYDTCG